MEDGNAAAGAGHPDPAQHGTQAARDGAPGERQQPSERERLADVRERTADERQRLADERERKASERERIADERERTADERERAADERERIADERERTANQRQRLSDEREQKLDERERRASGVHVDALHERALEAIDRARVLIALSGRRLDRREAGLERGQADREREQATIDRASAEGERDMAAAQPGPVEAMERSGDLRRRARETIIALAANEDYIARIHEELAASNPERSEEYRRAAENARIAAREARETLRTFTD